MEPEYTFNCSPKRISSRLRAILVIISESPDLIDEVFRHINLDSEIIKWDEILKLPLSVSHKRVVRVAHAVWSNEQNADLNLLDEASKLESNFQMALLRALAIRWGLRK